MRFLISRERSDATPTFNAAESTFTNQDNIVPTQLTLPTYQTLPAIFHLDPHLGLRPGPTYAQASDTTPTNQGGPTVQAGPSQATPTFQGGPASRTASNSEMRPGSEMGHTQARFNERLTSPDGTAARATEPTHRQGTPTENKGNSQPGQTEFSGHDTKGWRHSGNGEVGASR